MEALKRIVDSIHFTELDYLMIGLNIITLLGSRYLIKWSAHNRTPKELNRRVAALRVINVVILSTYLLAAIFDFKLGQTFAQISLTIIIAFAVNHVLQMWVLTRFGTEREVNGKTVLARSYTSGMIGLLTLILVISLSLVAILNILDLDNWLQTSSIIGAFLLILYASKDYLLSDMISSLLFHYNRSIEPGNVIRVEALNIFAVVQQITLTQTTLRDLVQGHEVTVSNSKLRGCVIENLSHTTGSVKDFIDFKIGYDNDPAKVEKVLFESWEIACKQESAIDPIKPAIKVINHDDHSIIWRLVYCVNNPYKLLETKHAFNLIALKHCHDSDVYLNTPLTHVVSGSLT